MPKREGGRSLRQIKAVHRVVIVGLAHYMVRTKEDMKSRLVSNSTLVNKIVSIIIGALTVVPKNYRKYLKKLPGDITIGDPQDISFRVTAFILKALSFEGYRIVQ